MVQLPIWDGHVHPAYLPDVKPTWAWVSCRIPFCGHARAVPATPWIIRWGPKDAWKMMRRNFRCSMCGTRGCCFVEPRLDGEGIEAFPDQKDRVRVGGGWPPIPGEVRWQSRERTEKAYWAKYPTGDAIGEFRGGPPGPASMCGKFTAMASWAEVVAFSQPLTREEAAPSDNDREITFRVMSVLPVIVWDQLAGKRRVVPMRWGFPDSKNWKVPKPIHARAETIDDPKKQFAKPFIAGQRGIVIVRTFNEAPDVEGPTVQHTITPGDLGAIGIAFVWRTFDIAELASTMTACVMVTVEANKLIATLPTDRMPAVLAPEEWATWLGEDGASPAAAKAILKPVEGVRWTMTKEERSRRGRPTVSDPKAQN